MPFLHCPDDGFELAILRLEDEIVPVKTLDGPVRRYDDDVEVVYGTELLFRGFRGSRHASDLLVHAEIVLERDGAVRLALAFDGDAFFRFDGLMQSFRPAPAGLETAGEFVHDDDLPVPDHILLIAPEKRLRLHRGLEMMRVLDAAFRVEVLDAQGALGLLDAGIGNDDGAELFVYGVIFLFF